MLADNSSLNGNCYTGAWSTYWIYLAALVEMAAVGVSLSGSSSDTSAQVIHRHLRPLLVRKWFGNLLVSHLNLFQLVVCRTEIRSAPTNHWTLNWDLLEVFSRTWSWRFSWVSTHHLFIHPSIHALDSQSCLIMRYSNYMVVTKLKSWKGNSWRYWSIKKWRKYLLHLPVRM